MTPPDSAWNALTVAVISSESPLAANLAEILADTIRELTEAQPSARIGAEPNQQTMSRTNLRNRHRDPLVSIPVRDLSAGFLRLRMGSIFPESVEPRRRIEQVLG